MREGFIRNLVFGVEDGLVSTLGFVSGLAAANVDRRILVLSGLVLIFVEAFSMAAGSFLSEESAREFRYRRDVRIAPAALGAFVMFIAYLAAGALVLWPYLTEYPGDAFWWSIGLSAFAMFLLGSFSARVAGVSAPARVARILVVGGLAVALGIFVGRVVLTSL